MKLTGGYLIYVETLDPETWKLSRNWTPVGYIFAENVADARRYARRDFGLKGNQRPHCERSSYTVDKIIKRQATAERKGKPIDFAEAWRRMLKARRGGKQFQEKGQLRTALNETNLID